MDTTTQQRMRRVRPGPVNKAAEIAAYEDYLNGTGPSVVGKHHSAKAFPHEVRAQTNGFEATVWGRPSAAERARRAESRTTRLTAMARGLAAVTR
ncbi:hypothetical protein Xcel_0575 [Xylanimonas cellulosilytica DSM 15894]|uniref:Uncharacterized protein n=1 Tax=Xylanimonas cellulosilytica (strain DSM 15894 / JCM 12276 / CECT 5975 / KCTC 9989 / LMG 20990 / NBRC 107835 / XIL07) TaxID=446471 RepID=D1BWN2_XYLCX|nr:hypothetical protein [Xylanimonas cellulosilytica]ACZ29614.1 hypothetical protein Xcel_0575 [Xylanimonas cellulosilytica DSM 15894]